MKATQGDIPEEGAGVCDETAYDAVEIPDCQPLCKQPESHWLRLRLHEPCKVEAGQASEWDMSEVSFYREMCDGMATTATPIYVNRSWSSGEAATSLNKQLALDGDSNSKWRGVEDEGGLVWIAVSFAAPEIVRCVKFVQCNCLRSARWAALEYNKDYNDLWTPVGVAASVVWGETSRIQVKHVDTRTNHQKNNDAIAEGMNKVSDWFKR
jgi:hypothetical protein